MDFGVYNDLINYIRGSTLLTIGAIALLAFLIWQKPKLFFGMFFLVLLLLGIFYLISGLSDTGSSFKKELVNEKKLPFSNEPR